MCPHTLFREPKNPKNWCLMALNWELGLSMSTAVDMFLRQVSLTGGIPFRVALPDAPRSVDADAMSDEELRGIFATGLREAMTGEGADAPTSFARMHEDALAD